MLNKKVWDSIGNKKTCAFKLHTKTDTLCKNVYNSTGFCNETSCPLANTKYATVREIDDVIYLFIKEPENCNTPIKMWDKIALDYDYTKALEQIEEHLKFWDEETKHRCKLRLNKMFEYLERRIEFEKNPLPELVVRKKKMNRREKIRALKALKSIDFEKNIGDELITRLETGIYGEELKQQYEDAMKKAEFHKKKRFVADIEELEEEKPKRSKKVKKQKVKNLEW